MRNVFAIIAIFSVSILTAQTSNSDRDASNMSNTMLAGTSGNHLGATTMFVNPIKNASGSVHLFDDWSNYAVIFTSDGEKFSLKNINLNVERNSFESKTEGDSIFSFNFNNIEKFVVNNREFKNYYYEDDNRVYEIIYEGPEFSVMKGFKVSVVEGSANPMLNRSADRYIKKESYYIKNGNKIKPFKLKKSKILKLVDGDEEKAANIEAYVKANHLSFKREYDVQRILEYGAKN